MEFQELFGDVSLWEPDVGLQESTWPGDQLDVNQKESGIGQIVEEDPIWKDAFNPLREASDFVIDDPCDLDFGKQVWHEENADIGSLLDNLLPELDFNNFNVPDNFFKNMEMTNEFEEIVEPPDEVKIIKIKEEVTSDPNIEIETDEIALQNTVAIYIDNSDSFELSSLSDDHFRILTDAKQEIETAILPSVSTTNKNECTYIDNSDTEAARSKLLNEDDGVSDQASSIICTKPKRGRKKTRYTPYRKTSTKSSCSSSNSSIYSSAPSSPSTIDCSDDTEEQPTSKRKERKKSQNRNAATKYRQKKRAESEAISVEEQELENKNKKLKEEVTSLETEINYLKGLMRDVLIARGIIKS